MRFDLISLFSADPSYAFNLLYPQAALKASGHTSSLFFLTRNNRPNFCLPHRPLIPSEKEIDLIIDRLKGADIAGLSVYYAFFDAARLLTVRIKERLGIPVVWGGRYPTLNPEACIEFTDMLCIGEGERVVVELADKMSSGKSITDVPGLWIKKNRSIIRNGPEQALLDVDTIPQLDHPRPDSHIVSIRGNMKARDPDCYYILASRGCVFSCSFCDENVWRKSCAVGSNHRVRSPAKIIEELEKVKNTASIKRVHFADSLFPFDPGWIKEFSTLYAEKIGLPFFARLQPATVNKDTVLLLKNAGLADADVSIESGSEKIRTRVFNRPVTDSRLLQAFNSILEAGGIRIRSNVIVDNPWETREDKQDSLDFLMRLRGRFRLDPFTLLFFPESDITKKAIQEGLIDQYHLRWAQRPFGIPSLLYKRRKEDVFWLCIIMLLSLYCRYRLFPKKLVLAVHNCRPIRYFPWPFFHLLYFFYYSVIYAGQGISILLERLRSIGGPDEI